MTNDLEKRSIKFQTNLVMDTIEWFQRQKSFDLAILMEKRRFLAVQNWALADLVSLAERAFISAEMERKRYMANRKQHYMQTGAKSIADAIRQVEAEQEFDKLYRAEKEAKIRAEHGGNLLRSLKGILDAAGQELAELRAEKKSYEDENTFQKVVDKVVRIVRENDARFPTQEPHQ